MFGPVWVEIATESGLDLNSQAIRASKGTRKEWSETCIRGQTFRPSFFVPLGVVLPHLLGTIFRTIEDV